MSYSNESVGPRLSAARAGLKQHLPKNVKSLKVGDEVYSLSMLDQLFAGLESKFTAADDAHAALTARVRERDEVAEPSRELLADFKTAMMHLLGRKNELLLKFGIKPQRDARRSRAGKTEQGTKPGTKPNA